MITQLRWLLRLSAFLRVCLAAGAVPAFGQAAAGETFEFEIRDDRIVISRAGKPLADYVFKDPEIVRPYFANVYTLGGIKATRNHPPVAREDADDHAAMHPGIWLGFGDVSGVDFWRNKGKIEHVRFIDGPTVDGGLLAFATESALRAEDGRAICKLTSRFTIAEQPLGYAIIWDATFRSDEREFAFGDQEEMGFGARVATAITEKSGGEILNSSGARTAAKTWGQPAEWCDYSGVIGGRRVGITLMPDPRNFRPSWQHNRDYGVFVSNPFGREAMKQGEKSAVTVKRGEDFRICFGALIHESPAEHEPDLGAAYQAFKTLLDETR